MWTTLVFTSSSYERWMTPLCHLNKEPLKVQRGTVTCPDHSTAMASPTMVTPDLGGKRFCARHPGRGTVSTSPGDSRITHLFIYSTNSNALFGATLYWTLLGPERGIRPRLCSRDLREGVSMLKATENSDLTSGGSIGSQRRNVVGKGGFQAGFYAVARFNILFLPTPSGSVSFQISWFPLGFQYLLCPHNSSFMERCRQKNRGGD